MTQAFPGQRQHQHGAGDQPRGHHADADTCGGQVDAAGQGIHRQRCVGDQHHGAETGAEQGSDAFAFVQRHIGRPQAYRQPDEATGCHAQPSRLGARQRHTCAGTEREGPQAGVGVRVTCHERRGRAEQIAASQADDFKWARPQPLLTGQQRQRQQTQQVSRRQKRMHHTVVELVDARDGAVGRRGGRGSTQQQGQHKVADAVDRFHVDNKDGASRRRSASTG